MNLNKIRVFQPNQESPVQVTAPTTIQAEYNRIQAIAVSIGGISAGYVPNGTVQDLLDRLLYPYQNPAFTAFQLSGQATNLEIGDSIIAGSKVFAWTTSNSSNIATNSILIKDAISNVVLASGLANDGTENITLSLISKSGNATHTFSIQATNTNAIVFSRNFDVLWRPRRFAGTIPATSLSALHSITSITSLNAVTGISQVINDLTYSKPTNNTFNCSGDTNGKYIWYLWDVTLGSATFTSGPAPAAFQAVQVIAFTNAFGITRNYNLYISSNPFNGSGVPITVN